MLTRTQDIRASLRHLEAGQANVPSVMAAAVGDVVAALSKLPAATPARGSGRRKPGGAGGEEEEEFGPPYGGD